MLYQPISNHESKDLADFSRKGRNTPRLFDINRTTFAGEGQIAQLPSASIVKLELQLSIGAYPDD